MTTSTTIKAGDPAKTITITEGRALVLTGAAGAAGVAYLLDPVKGGTNSTQSWALAAGASPQIGPFANTQKVLVSCGVGSIDGVVADAVVTVPQIVVSSAAPNNADGRPDGTLYIQTV
jgi:hypothetical protein